MHGAALGAVDSLVEREADEPDPLPRLHATRAILQAATISQVPFGEAIKRFGDRQVLPRPLFDQLSAAAKQRAFTVAGLANEELLGVAHAELQRQLSESAGNSYKDALTGKWIYKGPNLREFAKVAKERLEKAGWTPANPSHVETIFRTNIQSAYSAGRVAEMTQPDILKARPYWEIRAVGDSRTRATHRNASGTILSADNPYWTRCFPPFGYNCRCKCISRSKRWVDAHGGPTHAPMGLPDPNFTCGTNTLISSGIEHQQEGKRAPTPSKNPAHPLENAPPVNKPAPVPQAPMVIPEHVVSPTPPTLPNFPLHPEAPAAHLVNWASLHELEREAETLAAAGEMTQKKFDDVLARAAKAAGKGNGQLLDRFAPFAPTS
jgi:SPP1 gp7 family putative phage head morphogenesis protein